jgi:cellulose synthase/poly-beta-1,6-N-acetylglucosamine synthase-like glycosyltransferase
MVELLFWLSIAAIAYTYLIYPFVLWLINAISKVVIKREEIQPSVSLIISAYNEEQVMEERIKNCLSLDYPKEKLEIIIGSDASTDETNSIINKYEAFGVKLVNYAVRSGKVNVLNRIIPVAKGEIVILSDANTICSEDTVKKIVRSFADPTVGCVCGKLILRTPDKASGGELEGVYWRYENILKTMEGKRGALLGANGGIYAFRKELFDSVPSNTIVEDFVIPMKILIKGYKVAYAPDAIAYEDTSKSLADEHVRKIRIGAGVYQAILLTLPMLNIFRGFPSFAYWSHKVLRWLVPFFLIAILITNLLLLEKSLYQSTYMAQALFYAAALFGFPANKTLSRLKPFSLSYYFLSMNLCLLLGFLRFVTATQKVTWQRANR